MSDTKRELIKASFQPIAKALQEQEITMYRLSKLATVNYSTLLSWSNGDYKPKVDKIQSVCSALGLNYKDFI